jgi:hypothetical protein
MAMMGPQRLITATTRRETRSVVEEMVVAANCATHPQPKGRGLHPEHFKEELKGPCPFHDGQGKHLLKDYVTMSSYIRGTPDLKCKT